MSNCWNASNLFFCREKGSAKMPTLLASSITTAFLMPQSEMSKVKERRLCPKSLLWQPYFRHRWQKHSKNLSAVSDFQVLQLQIEFLLRLMAIHSRSQVPLESFLPVQHLWPKSCSSIIRILQNRRFWKEMVLGEIHRQILHLTSKLIIKALFRFRIVKKDLNFYQKLNLWIIIDLSDPKVRYFYLTGCSFKRIDVMGHAQGMV